MRDKPVKLINNIIETIEHIKINVRKEQLTEQIGTSVQKTTVVQGQSSTNRNCKQTLRRPLHKLRPFLQLDTFS